MGPFRGIKIRTVLMSVIMSVVVGTVANAQESDNDSEREIIRPVLSAYTVETGGAGLTDTYLSPVKYSGWSLGLRYDRMQAMKFCPEKWVMRLTADIDFDKTVNRVGNASMLYAGIYFDWGMMRRQTIVPGLTLGYGGSAALSGGCLYLNRNGNNPVSAKAALTVNLTGYLAWNTSLGHLPLTLAYQPTLPVTGVFFSPDYGELYYEIYLGNHSGLAHAAWWGNYFSMNNRVTADFHFGGTSLRIGYEFDVLSTKVNNITTNIYGNRAIIGISGEWISLNPRKKISEKAKTIRSLWE